MKADPLAKAMIAAARRGAEVDLLVHDTERRVTSDTLGKLTKAGVSVTRVRHPEGLPMHAKFLIVEQAGAAAAWLGSYNYNRRSRLRNAEVLLRTRDAATVAALRARFGTIAEMAR